MATEYCNPHTDQTPGSNNDKCNLPDPRLLDLRKGTNPMFLAYQANRVRFQRTRQLNKEILNCNDDLEGCAFVPGRGAQSLGFPIGDMEQKISGQDNFVEVNGEWVPSDTLSVMRRSHVDYAASTHQGQMIGDEINNDMFRNVQQDERQCILYNTRCGVGDDLINNINSSVTGSVNAAEGAVNINARRRREQTREEPNRQQGQVDRPTRGYEDRV